MLFCNLFIYHLPPSVILSETKIHSEFWSVRVAERLALPTSDPGVTGSNPAGGEILPEPKRRFIVQSLSCSPFHRLEMSEILLKGRKTLSHPSIIILKSVLKWKKCHFLHFNTFLLSRHAFVENLMQCSKLQSLSHRILNCVLKTRNRSPFPTGKCYEGEGLCC